MKKNIAKQKIKKGIPSIGTWVSSGNPLVCETLATSGIDWINIECEHSSIDLGELVHCFRAVEHSDIPVSLGCELTEHGYIKVDDFQKTTVPGIYACGDNSNMMRSIANAVYSGNVTGVVVNRELTSEQF